MMQTKKAKWIAIAAGACIAAFGAVMTTLYFTPVSVTAHALTEGPYYQYDPIEKADFSVYQVSALGKETETEDYVVPKKSLDPSGTVLIETDLGTVQQTLDVIPAVSVKVRYDGVLYEDEPFDVSAVKEVITYEDGTVKELSAEELEITASPFQHSSSSSEKSSAKTTAPSSSAMTDRSLGGDALAAGSATISTLQQEKDTVSSGKKKKGTTRKMQISSPIGEQTLEVEVIGIKKLQTKDTVTTGKPLTSDSVAISVVYEDGTTKRLDSDDVISDRIQKPKAGKNVLQCTYCEKDYPVTVNAKMTAGEKKRLAIEKEVEEAEAAAKKIATEKTPKSKASSSARIEMPIVTNSVSTKTGYTVRTVTGVSGGTTINEDGTYEDTISHSATPLTPFKGAIVFDGHRETYYSQKVLPGGGLNIPGRHVAPDGTIRDGEGYICVANEDVPKGSLIMTSLGVGKVYDAGCPSGTVDIYVDW
ncbi:MAG: hypothetical protein PUC32_01360 [Oscillospiraceae bacterium]|nr:hypothetical protein [Oscillospiraceae bacterium]